MCGSGRAGKSLSRKVFNPGGQCPVMAKSKGRKKSWQTIEVQLTTDLAAGVAALDLVKDQLTADSADDNFICTSVDLSYSAVIEQAAEPNGVGPLLFGLAKSDYSDAEIEAWVENASGFTRANLIQQEISKRHIKHVGTFDFPSIETGVAAGKVKADLINNGRPIHTRLNWRIVEGTSISIWIYNAGDVAVVATSGQDIITSGKLNGFWED